MKILLKIIVWLCIAYVGLWILAELEIPDWLFIAIFIVAVIMVIKHNINKKKQGGNAASDSSDHTDPKKYEGCSVLELHCAENVSAHFNSQYSADDVWYAKDGTVYLESKRFGKTYKQGHYYDYDSLSKLNLKNLAFVGYLAGIDSKKGLNHPIDYYLSQLKSTQHYLVTDGKSDNIGEALGFVPKNRDGILGWQNFQGFNTANLGAYIGSTWEKTDRFLVSYNGNFYDACAAYICMMDAYSKRENNNSWSWE